MACRGVFFALTDEQAAAVLAAEDDDELMELIEEIEEAWDSENLVECDKAWDAIHRTLTDGQLEWANGSYPLNHAVLGSRPLHEGDDYLVSYVSADQVREVSRALQAVTRDWFIQKYRDVVPKDYAPEYGEEDLQYTWDWFEGVREFYGKAADRGRAVIFTVDQ
jgi:hypothetical protein